MRAFLFCCLSLLAVNACAADSAKVLTAEDFLNNRVPRCSGDPGRLGPIALLIQISPSLPPYQFTLISEPATAPEGAVHRVGRIEISNPGSGATPQIIEVTSIWNDSLCQLFDALDVNFDGYLDIAVVRDGGTKWASRDYYLFDPQSGRFVTNALTQDLDRVESNGIILDRKTHEIQADILSSVCGGTEIYKIEGGRLVKVQEIEVVPVDPASNQGKQCITKVKRRVNAQWKVVRVE